MNSTDRFEIFFKEFRSDPMWLAMEATVENSPWHRETNVAVHTAMLIEYYKSSLIVNRTEEQRMLTLLSCLFHDVGKPPSEVVKNSPERGEYRAYHGHELRSARMWVNYSLTNKDMIFNFLQLSLQDVSNIALMLEHHVPFALKDRKKRKSLKEALHIRMGKDGHQAWLDMLNSDQNGRISDDQAIKLAHVALWMKEWEEV